MDFNAGIQRNRTVYPEGGYGREQLEFPESYVSGAGHRFCQNNHKFVIFWVHSILGLVLGPKNPPDTRPGVTSRDQGGALILQAISKNDFGFSW
jgi:hypothetical protein